MDALQKLFICLDIAEAVNHIHSKGFIQKDLKIGNIYLDELMIPRVSNFGTNADISNDQVDPKDLYVRSPETIMSKIVTSASDVYSFGMIVYEMFFEQRPFAGISTYEFVKGIERGILPDMSREIQDPYQIRSLITKCVDHNPTKRYDMSKVVEYIYNAMNVKKLQLPKDLSGYNMNFHSTLSNTTMQHGFAKYTLEKSVIDSFHFLLCLQMMPRDSRDDTIAQFDAICERFIYFLSPEEINIDFQSRVDIMNSHQQYLKCGKWDQDESPLSVLQVARTHCIQNLDDHGKEWIKLPSAYHTILSVSDNPDVISRDPTNIVLEKIKDSFFAENLDDKKMLEFANNLSRPNLLISNYLTMDWKATEDLEAKIRESFQSGKVVQDQIESSSYIFQRYNSGGFKVKVVVLQKRKQKKWKAQFFSPIFNALENVNSVPEFTTGLLIGPMGKTLEIHKILLNRYLTSSNGVSPFHHIWLIS